ncbi:MAG TPA: signal peptidase II [Ktedonobacteraceae bacterium]|nr:signal peptidase II [Ktedonobacteraceae bacterium]
MKHRRARIYDALALLTVVLVLVLDQWTKAWVVTNLSPSFFGPRISLVGDYLILYYIKNNGAAFSLFANSMLLVLLIAVAIGVIAYLYMRNINTASLWYKLIFGLIIGGALSNLLDRVRHGGYVVDFISFNIPQLNFHFAIFNLADAAISIGVVLLFVTLLLGSIIQPEKPVEKTRAAQETSLIPPSTTDGEVLQSSKEHDTRS